MLANTQSIRCAFCLTCQKICRRDSSLRIVRCCPKAFLRGSSTGKSRWFPYSIKNALRFGAQAFVLNSAAGALGGKATKQRFMMSIIHIFCPARHALPALHRNALPPLRLVVHRQQQMNEQPCGVEVAVPFLSLIHIWSRLPTTWCITVRLKR